jgi:hypothetical protein
MTDRRDDDERLAQIEMIMNGLHAHTEELHRIAAEMLKESRRGVAATRRTIATSRANVARRPRTGKKRS